MNTIDTSVYGQRPKKDYISLVANKLGDDFVHDGNNNLSIDKNEISLPMNGNNHHTIGYTEQTNYK